MGFINFNKLLILLSFLNIPKIFSTETKEIKKEEETTLGLDQAAIDFLKNTDVSTFEGKGTYGFSYFMHNLREKNEKLYNDILSVANYLRKIVFHQKNLGEFEQLLKLFLDDKTGKLKENSMFVRYYLINDLTYPTLFDIEFVKKFLKYGGNIDKLIEETNQFIRAFEYNDDKENVAILDKNLKRLEKLKR